MTCKYGELKHFTKDKPLSCNLCILSYYVAV